MNAIVVPTAKEFLAARGDRRLAYLACITAFHICDYVYRADGPDLGAVKATIKTACEPSYEIVSGICNGSKHCGRNVKGSKISNVPGSERDVPIFAYGVASAGYGQGRYGCAGLEAEYAGQQLFVRWCLQAFLISAKNLYPHHFADVDFAWTDAAFRA